MPMMMNNGLVWFDLADLRSQFKPHCAALIELLFSQEYSRYHNAD